MDVLVIQGIIDSDPATIDIGMLEQMKTELEAATVALAEIPEPPAEAIETVELIAVALQMLETEQRRRLDALCLSLSADFEKAIRARQDAEARMIADDRQWEGKCRDWGDSKAYPNDSMATDLGDDQDRTIKATRSRQQLFAARLTDMMLPTNEIPFRVDPDEQPDPTCIPSFKPPQPQPGAVDPQTGQPGAPVEPTEEDIRAAIEDANNRAAGKMQDTIKDQLAEAGLNRHGRRCIDDATRIGVGLTHGPANQYKRKTKIRFVDGSPEPVVEIQTSTVPGYRYVNPYMFWYDMVPDLAKSRKTFEAELYDRSEMMELKKYPNTIHSAIDELLAEKDPSMPPALAASISRRNTGLGLIEPITGRWAVIRTYAAIDPEKLEEIGGIAWEHKDVMPLVEMLWCNGKCLKWKLSELECGYRVPYYAFTPFPLDDTIYGASVSYLARAAQHNLDGAWQATLANAAISAGPQVFVSKGNVSPMDGAMRIVGGPKFWNVTGLEGGSGRVADAIFSLIINSNVEGNLALVDKAMEIMDQDTLLSQILQGNITEASQGPAAGLVQIINLATIIQRAIAARADDGWFQPMAEQWGMWNALYNPDQTIKGDFNYKGIASTALVSKDVQIQHTQVLTGMAADPRFAGFTDDYELWAGNVKMLDIPNKDAIVLPRDKALEARKAMQASQADPLAQAKMAEIELAKQKSEADVTIRMKEIELEMFRIQQEGELKREEMEVKLVIAQNDMQRALIEASSKQQVAIEKIAADAQKATRDDATKKTIEGMHLAVKTKMEAAKLAATPSPYSAQD